MRQFDYVFTLFIFLASIECLFVFPSERRFATFAVYIGNCVQSCQKNSFLCRTATNIDDGIEQISSSLAALKRLRNQFVVIGQMSSTMYAGIHTMTFRQISLKSFHHICCTVPPPPMAIKGDNIFVYTIIINSHECAAKPNRMVRCCSLRRFLRMMK